MDRNSSSKHLSYDLPVAGAAGCERGSSAGSLGFSGAWKLGKSEEGASAA